MSSSNGRVAITFDMIQAADDTDREWVAVPEWAPAGTAKDEREHYGVYVRSASAGERERLMKASAVVEGRGRHAKSRFDMPTFRVKLAALTMQDLDGNRVMSESQVSVLEKRNARVVERISDVAVRLAGIEDDLTETDGDGRDDGTPAPVEETAAGKGFSGPTTWRAASTSTSASPSEA